MGRKCALLATKGKGEGGVFPFSSGPRGELVSKGSGDEQRGLEVSGLEGWWRGKGLGIFGACLC